MSVISGSREFHAAGTPLSGVPRITACLCEDGRPDLAARVTGGTVVERPDGAAHSVALRVKGGWLSTADNEVVVRAIEVAYGEVEWRIIMPM